MDRIIKSSRPARTLRVSALMALALALTLTLSACSGGDTSSPPAGQSTASPNAKPEPSSAGSSDGGDQPATATVVTSAAPTVSGNGAGWSKVNACELLTRQELEAVVGPIGADAAPDPDYSAAIDGRASCRFNDLNGSYRVLLAIGPSIMWDSEHGAADLESLDPQNFAGIGDDAFVAGRMLVARWHGEGVTIRLSLYNFETPFDPEQAKQLILKAFARLP